MCTGGSLLVRMLRVISSSRKRIVPSSVGSHNLSIVRESSVISPLFPSSCHLRAAWPRRCGCYADSRPIAEPCVTSQDLRNSWVPGARAQPKKQRLVGRVRGAEVCAFAVKRSRPRAENSRRPPDKRLEGRSAPISSSPDPPCQSQQRRFNESQRTRVLGRAAPPRLQTPSSALQEHNEAAKPAAPLFITMPLCHTCGCFGHPPHRKEEVCKQEGEMKDLGHFYP